MVTSIFSFFRNIFYSLTLSQTSPGFYTRWVDDLKILWEKEKMLLTNIFSFSHSAFFSIKDKF